MKKTLLFLILFLTAHIVYGQSKVTIGTGASVSVGANSNVVSGSRDGTMLNTGTFNSRSIVYDPVTIAASAVGPTGFTANWNASAGANGYKLDVSTVSNFASYVSGYQNLDVGSSVSSAVSGLNPGTTYYYRVRAYDIDGITGYSNITTLITAPLAPSVSAASNINESSFAANWAASAGATKYYLDVATTSGFDAGTFVTGYENLLLGNVITYSVNTNLTANTTYYYRVRAANNYGASANSETITVLTAPLPPVAGAAAPIGQTSFSANWTAPAGATKYYLDVNVNPSFLSGQFVSGYQNLDVGNVTTYSVNTNLTAGTIYYYRIRSNNGTGTSTNSNEITLSTAPPDPVATAAGAISQSGFTANWGASTNAAQYFIDVATNNTFTSPVPDWTDVPVGNVTTYVVNTNISPGTHYYYRIRASNPYGTSGYSNVIDFITVPPNPVAIDASDMAQTSFTANWNASANATGYYLDVSENNTFNSFVSGWNNKNVANVATYSVNSGLTAGTAYYYRVRAYNANGTSGSSGTVSTILIPPNPATLAASGVSTTHFTANWNTALGASNYYLDVATDNLFEHPVGTWTNVDAGAATSYLVDTGLSAGTTYYYRVSAHNASGTSLESDVRSVLTAPGKPTATAASTFALTSFSANWDPTVGASGYYLDVATANTFAAGTFVVGYENLDVTNVNTYSVNSNLTAGTHYYYRVRSYNSGGTSASSDVITAATTPASPIASAASSITSAAFYSNWNTVAGATGYRLDVSTTADITTGIIAAYTDKDVGNVITYQITGLNANTTYYYRVKAYNDYSTGSGSNVITVLTVPAAPVTSAASSVGIESMAANWVATDGASGYYLDVSISPTFASYVTGYQSLDVGNVITYPVTGLQSGTTYYYQVRAYSSGGTSVNSDRQTVILLPSVPVATAATGAAATTFTANWNTVTGATGYKLDVSSDPAFGAGNFVINFEDITVATNTKAVTGLTAGVTYYYRVRSTNVSGTGTVSSNVIDVTTIPPAPVEQAAGSITKNSFAANWALSSGATGYKLDVSTDAGFGSFVPGYNNLDVGNVLTYSTTGLTAGTIYYYQVRAYNTSGTSASSGSTTVTTSGTAPRTPSVNPASVIATNSFTASWSASAGATKYYLDVATDPGFAALNLVAGFGDLEVAGTSKSVTGLTAGTPYYYRVRASNGTDLSANSSTVSLVTLPAKTTSLTSSGIVNNGFTVTWDAMTGATGYKIDVSTDTGFGTLISPYSNLDIANVTTYNVIGLNANTTYYCRVKAYNTGGEGEPADYVTVLTTNDAATFFASPATAITGTTFTANWTTHASAAKYTLDVSTDPAFGAGSFVGTYHDLDVALVTTYPVSGLSTGTNYYYRIKAYDAVPALLATTETVTVLTKPAAPTLNAAAGNTETSFTASWNASTGATGYYLDVANDNGFTSFVTGFNDKYVNSATSYSVTGLTAGSTYYYQVRAKNGSGISASSLTGSTAAIPKEPTPLAAASILSTSFDAKWNTSTGATGYKIDVATDAGFTAMVPNWSNIDAGALTTKSVNTDLTSGTTYYYQIRAYNDGGTSGSSSVIALTTAPAVPTVAAANPVGANSFTAKWNSVSGATKYFLDVAATDVFTGAYLPGYENLDVSSATSYPVSGLSSGTNYYYRVRAYSPSGTSGDSGSQTVLTLPAAPVVLSATDITTTSFSANWVKVTGATKYYVDVSAVANFATFVVSASDAGDNATKNISGVLSANTTYYYRVRSYNATGLSSNSEIITVTTAPAAPTATAASSLQETNILANWDASAGVTGYLLDVATDIGFGAGTFVSGFENKDVHNVINYTVTGLSGGVNYWYRIRSYTGSRISDYSNKISLLTKPAAPAALAPSNVSTASFDANWNTVASATKYYLEVATNPGFTAFVPNFNPKDAGGAVTWSITGLTQNTNYYYRVSAYNASGTGAVSNIQTVLTAPVAPTANAATSVTNVSLSANWTSSAGATGYYLDVSNNSAFTDIIAEYNNKDAGNVTSYSVTNLNGAHTYYYRVRAYNTGGTSSNSNTTTAVTADDPSPAPVSSAATSLAETGFAANWAVVATATGYRLDVATNNLFTNFVTGFQDLNVNNVLTYPVTGLTGGTTYYFRTRSYNISGTSSNSNVITVLTVPAKPTSNAATSISETGFTANWTASAGATKYYLDVATDAGFTSILGAYTDKDVANVITYAVTGLTGGAEYFYRVRSYNASGTSTSSGTQTVLTVPAPPAATAAGSVTSTGFTANWTASTGATKYFIDVSTDKAFGSFVTGYNNKDAGNVITLSVTGLTAHTTYYYRLRALNANGTSTNSNIIAIIGLPTASAATLVNESGFKANWSAVAGVTKYKIDISTASDFSSFAGIYNNYEVADSASLAVTGLTANTTYYYRVRAFNADGTSGNSENITVTTAPLPPVASAATALTPTGFTANWAASAGATGYYIDIARTSAFTTFLEGYENLNVGNVTSLVISGGERGISYYYRLRAYNASATSGNSSVISILAAPSISPASDIMQTSFTANWNSVTGATKYYLDVATDASFTSFVAGFNNLDVGNVTSKSVPGLVKNTEYFYRVRSFDGVKTSENSLTVSVRSLPDAPTATAATAITQNSFSANWILVPGTPGYRLDVATDAAFTSIITIYNNIPTGNVNTYAVSGLTTGQTYYYRLRASNSWGASDNSNVITVALAPANPVAIQATKTTTNSFDANWNLSIGSTGYRIDVANDSTFATLLIDNKDCGANLSWSIGSLKSNTTYFYRVKGYNASGTSSNSNFIEVTTMAEKPAITKLEPAAIDYSIKQAEAAISDSLTVIAAATVPIYHAEIKISSNYVKNEDQLLFVNSNGITGSWDNENGILTLTSTGTPSYQDALRSIKYINNSLQPSSFAKTITITVRNEFFASDPVSRNITIKTGNLPPALTQLEKLKLTDMKGVSPLRIPLTDSLTVTDTDNMYLYSAVIKISTGYIKDEDFLDFTNTGGITGVFNKETGALSLSGKAAVQNYQNFIKSLTYRNSNGANGTSSSKALEFTVYDGLITSGTVTRLLEVKAPLETPSDLKGTIISNRVDLTWKDTNHGEDGYIIERSEGTNTAYTEIARTDSNAVAYSDATIKDGIKYFYHVAAFKNKLKSDYSNEISVTGIVVGISDLNGLPTEYIISQNYPNPFNPATSIVYGLPQESKVRIEVYNSIGQCVEILVNESQSAGYYKLDWNARSFSSGVYIYRLDATAVKGNKHFIEAKRMILLK
jgi:titin